MCHKKSKANHKSTSETNAAKDDKGRSRKEKRDYVGKVPKQGGGRSDPNPLLDVYLPSYFWHAKMIPKACRLAPPSLKPPSKSGCPCSALPDAACCPPACPPAALRWVDRIPL